MATLKISQSKIDALRQPRIEWLEGYIVDDPRLETEFWEFKAETRLGEWQIKVHQFTTINRNPQVGDFFIIYGFIHIKSGLFQVPHHFGICELSDPNDISQARRRYGIMEKATLWQRFEDYLLSEQVRLLKQNDEALYKEFLVLIKSKQNQINALRNDDN